jgi:hypothetical protein
VVLDERSFLEIPRVDPERETPGRRLRHWGEYEQLLTDGRSAEQAARCMDCSVPWCHAYCPVHNQIPEWNALVSEADWRAAWEQLESTSNFPELTGRLCPAPCEDACTLRLSGAPVTIRAVELAIIERAWHAGWVRPQPAVNRDDRLRRRVAVVIRAIHAKTEKEAPMKRMQRRLSPMPWFAGIALGLSAVLPLAAPAAESPYTMPDEAWISIDGTVESVSPDSFKLDYGDGRVTVEMDDGDRDADAYALLPGDEVNVVGKVDDDLFERTTIEALSVYVQKLETTFYASAVDEEDVVLAVSVPVDVSSTNVRGKVSSVGDGEFGLQMGGSELTVSTESLGYDPLDDKGYQKVEVGDRVSVTGDMDAQFFGGPLLKAASIIVLQDARSNGDDQS